VTAAGSRTAEGTARTWTGVAARRLLRFAALVAAVSVVAFALAKLSPVDPVDAYLGAAALRVGPEQRDLIAAEWGFDQPALVQFGAFARNMLSGDWGVSATYNAPVAQVIGERAGGSLALMGVAWVLSGILGFALGLAAGAREGSPTDRLIRLYAYVLAATPTFWLAIVLLLVFAVSLGIAPICCAAPVGTLEQDVTRLERLRHLALPAAALTLLGVAQVTLHTRAKAIEIMRSDIALYARAQGASELDVVRRHVARNAALPALTIQFASIGELFGGSILTEQVFSYPGLGQATVEAGLRGDVPLLLAITILTTACVSFGNAVADILYRLIDPGIGPAGRAA
jgi:peptide/nickel transport system permease protein